MGDIFDPAVVEYAIGTLGGLGIGSVELATGLIHRDIEACKGCILAEIPQPGTAIRSYPRGKVIQACIRIKNSAHRIESSSEFPNKIDLLTREQAEIESQRSAPKPFSPRFYYFQIQERVRMIDHPLWDQRQTRVPNR